MVKIKTPSSLADRIMRLRAKWWAWQADRAIRRYRKTIEKKKAA